MIFADGFKSLGNNDNLNDHVRGTSCIRGTNKPNSAFVATTASEQFAKEWGRDRIALEPDNIQNYYVYRIRATGNFYNATESLLNAEYEDQAYNKLRQKEWLAYNGVITSQIEKVDVYGRPTDAGNVPKIRTKYNTRYIHSESRS